MAALGSPLIFGEVLFDCFDDRQVLGGAPFNVAWNLRGFGVQPQLVSRIGDDPLGNRVLLAMAEWGMDTRWVQRDPEHPTGKVRVRVENGEPQFTIEPDQAYDFIESVETAPLSGEISPTLLYHGTLAARHPCSRRSLLELRTDSDLPVFVDVNLRAPWWEPAGVIELIRGARWSKLNEAELRALGADHDDIETAAGAFQTRHGIDVLVVTRGARGAIALVGGERFSTPAVPVEGLVDTVGAGDAFSAVLIMGILGNWTWPVALERAADFAAAVCTQQGAIRDTRSSYLRAAQEWTDV